MELKTHQAFLKIIIQFTIKISLVLCAVNHFRCSNAVISSGCVMINKGIQSSTLRYNFLNL